MMYVLTCVCIMCMHMCLIISSPVPATTTSGSRRPLKKKGTRGGDNDPEPEKEVSEEKDGNILMRVGTSLPL